VVQVAVARIEVVGAVSREALLLEEELPQAVQPAQLVGAVAIGIRRLREVVDEPEEVACLPVEAERVERL